MRCAAQVLYLPRPIGRELLAPDVRSWDMEVRERERMMRERQGKWEANAGQVGQAGRSKWRQTLHGCYHGTVLQIQAWQPLWLMAAGLVAHLQPPPPPPPGPASPQVLELLSSTGVLAEVTLERGVLDGAPASLAAMGYAAPAVTTWLDSVGWAPGGRLRVPRPEAGAARGRRRVPPKARSPSSALLRLEAIEPLVSARLVRQRSRRDAVVAGAVAATGLLSLPMPVPSASVRTDEDARWVAAPGRYTVARKADGQRHLLIVTGGGAAYMRNRVGSLYAFPIAFASGDGPATPSAASEQPATAGSEAAGGGVAACLPPGTVLDGELLWLGGVGFFLAFDALAVAGRPVWHLPLDGRLAALEALGMEEAGACAALAAAHEQQRTQDRAAPEAGMPEARGASAQSSRAAAPQPSLRKKQQAPPPERDTVTVLRKRHAHVSEAELRAMVSGGPFPADGLVFTPRAAPYVLGMQVGHRGREPRCLLPVARTPWPEHQTPSAGHHRSCCLRSYRDGLTEHAHVPQPACILNLPPSSATPLPRSCW
jgi:hypothetical protein